MGRFAAALLVFVVACAPGGAEKDRQPPTVPAGITITSLGSGAVKVSWSPCRDNGVLKGYRVYRNGVFLKETGETSFSETGLKPREKQCYRVSAYDAAGNESAPSQEVCAMF